MNRFWKHIFDSGLSVFESFLQIWIALQLTIYNCRSCWR